MYDVTWKKIFNFDIKNPNRSLHLGLIYMLNKVVSASWRKLALTQVVFVSNPDSGHLGPQVSTRSVLCRPSFDCEASALTDLSFYYSKTMRISFGNESILLCRHVGRYAVKIYKFKAFLQF